MSSGTIIVFGTLAMNQTLFFEALGDALEEAGLRTAYLCFHERSHEYLLKRGRRSFNAFREGAGGEEAIDLSQYGWPSLNLILSHEKAVFEIDDTNVLLRKLRRYLAACESAMAALQDRQSGDLVLVQELGGFLSNMASFYVARRRGVDNIFIEPSFFRGRVFFVRNTFAAPKILGPRSPQVSEEVATYLEDTVARQKVVIPSKDAHHYRRPISKITDPRHMRRLAQKSFDKYLLGRREEFAHIGGHVSRHARMFVNSTLLRNRYQTVIREGERFVYYPLHVPADVALTIRSPEYLDQYALIDFVARAVPGTHRVLIKEHPALVGAVDRRRILDLLQTRDNVSLLDPRINNYEVMRRADAVLTVNSKSGAEAMLLGRPVVVLGDAFYTLCELVRRVESLAALPVALKETLATGMQCRPDSMRRYFQDIWNSSWPGELYVAAQENASTFAGSLLRFSRAEKAERRDIAGL